MTEEKSIENNNFLNLSFEAALSDLESIARQIDSGALTLEESINSYEKGIMLKNYCEMKLKEAALKIEKIVVSAEGIKTEKVEL